MNDITAMPPIAAARIPESSSGMKNAMYRAKMTEVAAMIPEWTLQNMAQPHKNPHAGESVSFRKT